MTTSLPTALLISLCFLGLSAKGADSERITPEFLVKSGFVQSKEDTNSYDLKSVPLKEAAKRLGFSPKQMKKTPSNPRFSDVRIVKVRDLVFVIRSEVRDSQGRVVEKSLDAQDAICSVSVSLLQVPIEKEKRKGKDMQPNGL